MVDRAPQLPLVHLERSALEETIRDDAVCFNPVRDDPQRREINDVLRPDRVRLRRRRHGRPSAGSLPKCASAPRHWGPSRFQLLRSAPAPPASPGSSTAANPSSAEPTSPTPPWTRAARTQPVGDKTAPPQAPASSSPTGPTAGEPTDRSRVRVPARWPLSAAILGPVTLSRPQEASPTDHRRQIGASHSGQQESQTESELQPSALPSPSLPRRAA